MHELSVTQSILEIALDYGRRNSAARIVEIHLQIGEITDFSDEWLQRYFDFISKGTIAEGAHLRVSRIEAKMQCRTCSRIFPLDQSTWSTECPGCGRKESELVCGREFRIEALEVE